VTCSGQTHGLAGFNLERWHRILDSDVQKENTMIGKFVQILRTSVALRPWSGSRWEC
jgi:hypothetical protein